MNSENKQVMRITSTQDKIHIEWDFQIHINERGKEKFSCFIPGFNIYYSAKSEEMIQKKAKAFTKFFFDHYLLETKNQTIGFKRLMLDLNKKGYRDARHSDVMYKSMKDLPFKASMVAQDVINLDKYESVRSAQAVMEAVVQ